MEQIKHFKDLIKKCIKHGIVRHWLSNVVDGQMLLTTIGPKIVIKHP